MFDEPPKKKKKKQKIKFGRKEQSNLKVCSSVSDPYHFDSDPDLDPDPGIRIRDDGSGSGSEVTFDSVNRIFPIKCYARL